MIELKEEDVFEGQIEFSTNGNASIAIEDKEIFIYKKYLNLALDIKNSYNTLNFNNSTQKN